MLKIAVNRTTDLLRKAFHTYRRHDRIPTYAERSMTNEVTYLSACTLSVPFKTITIRISPFRSQWRLHCMTTSPRLMYLAICISFLSLAMSDNIGIHMNVPID